MSSRNFKYPQIDMKKTGERLRLLSRNMCISVKDIQAALCLASNQAVYDWFNGKTLPTINNLYALSRLLQVPMDNLIVEMEDCTEQKSTKWMPYLYKEDFMETTGNRLLMYETVINKKSA